VLYHTFERVEVVSAGYHIRELHHRLDQAHAAEDLHGDLHSLKGFWHLVHAHKDNYQGWEWAGAGGDQSLVHSQLHVIDIDKARTQLCQAQRSCMEPEDHKNVQPDET